MSEIIFKKDQYLCFKATQEVALGAIRPSGYRTFVGEIVQFDGFRIKLDTGESVEAPHFRAAIRAGWFVPTKEGEVSSETMVSLTPEPPTPTKTTVLQYEDQIVSTRSGDKFQAESSSAAARFLSRFNQEVTQTSTETSDPNPEPVRVAVGGSRKFAIRQQEEFEGEGIPISGFKSKVQEIPRHSGAEGIFEDQKAVSSFNPTIRTEGSIQLENSAQVHKGSTDSVIVGEAAVVGTNKDATPASLRRKIPMRSEDEQGTPVSSLKTPTSFSQTIHASTSVSTSISQLEKQAKVVPGVVVHSPEGVATQAASSEGVSNEDRDAEVLKIVQHLVPGFKWDKGKPPSERIKAGKTVKNGLVRRAILAYESPEVVKSLQKHWESKDQEQPKA